MGKRGQSRTLVGLWYGFLVSPVVANETVTITQSWTYLIKDDRIVWLMCLDLEMMSLHCTVRGIGDELEIAKNRMIHGPSS
jgi:hypothetical protein